MSILKKGGGLKKDWLLVFVIFGAFQLALWIATKAENALGWDLFQLVGILGMASHLFAVSALIWVFTKLVFPATLGKDFGAIFNKGWSDFSDKEKTAATLVVFLVLFFGLSKQGSSEELALPISEEGLELIVYYEVGGKSYYDARLHRPTWPGGASGVTVGFGYDVGYNTKAQIARDWKGVASPSEISALQSVAGLKGSRARYAVSRVRNRVRITYHEAQRVFEKKTLPRFANYTAKAFKIEEGRLHPHCNGALVSIVFNRGSKVDYSNRRREMAWIRHNLSRENDSRVPGDIRSMKRLWVGRGLNGLLKRRDAEARLFEKGRLVRG